VDFEHSDDQTAILEAVTGLLAQHAGPARAIELHAKEAYDEALDAALRDAGFADVAQADGAGPLEAALITEAVAEAGGVVAFAASALVASALRPGIEGPVALCSVQTPGPVRYAAHARSLLVLDVRSDGAADGAAAEARLVTLEPGACEPVRSSFGYPMGKCPEGVGEQGLGLGAGSGEALGRWWRLALAVEATGTMAAALDVTVAYLRERRQFGVAIGSFQAVQHRLAECAIHVEASRWLCREAAFLGAPAEGVATAAAYVLAAAGQVFSETHQLSGAIGFTREHDLHVFSMRLQALRIELGGLAGHRRALARERWGAG
jgi:alkylation response protein AidB-like acyl-CoA dehydrogenase